MGEVSKFHQLVYFTITLQTHNRKQISYQRQCNTMTSHRRRYDVVLTPFCQLGTNCVLYILAVNQVLEKVGPSLSWFSVFIGLNGTSEELGLHAGNTFAFSG